MARVVAVPAFLAALALGGLRAQTISEIHYHPKLGDEALEFVEVANDLTIPIDLSGYTFTAGIGFTFPQGTIVPARESIVVCADAAAVREHYGIENAVGNFTGRLDGSGEELVLVNHAGVQVSRVRYRVGGKWPVAPDGTGHTLALLDPHLDSGEPESWTTSLELGGTPGRENIPDKDEPRFEETVFLPGDAEWRYRKGTEAFSDPPEAWIDPSFDDSLWEIGRAGFGFEDDDDTTILDDMRNGYTTVAIRTRVTLSAEGLEEAGNFFLGVLFDDGFCAWVNGESATGANCPDPPLWNETATTSHEAQEEEVFPVDRDLFHAGENTIAILGYNRSFANSDFSLRPRFFARKPLEVPAPGDFPVVFNELYRGAGNHEAWVELYNTGLARVQLAGIGIVDDPDASAPWTFPPGAAVEPGGFVVVSAVGTGLDLARADVSLFLIAAEGSALAAARFDAFPPETSDFTEFSQASYPDGGELAWVTDDPTRGEPNRVPVEDRIVISEIHYHPPHDRPGEFIEIYNRSGDAIDISGFRFDSGVGWTFPPGTLLGGGEYAVVSEAPEVLRANYGLDRVFGPWEGRLANNGENVSLVDRNGNLVDEVRYHDGGDWPEWADAGGASLELVDPRADNDLAQAWRASDESGKTSWEELSYEADYIPAGESELHVILPERGVVRIDDVSIVRVDDPEAENLIPNPGFEENTRPWRIEGTHGSSERVEYDAYSGAASLEIRATGKGDSGCNRVETDTATRLTRARYRVSLRARWVSGSDLLILHGEFASGPWFGTRDVNMSGNSLGARFRLSIPDAIGTPGAENSVSRIAREELGRIDTGPAIGSVHQDPPAPDGNVSVLVTARIDDPDGMTAARLHFALDGRTFQETMLEDGGENGDRTAGDGVFTGTIPPATLRSRVSFWIEAEDAGGLVGVYPESAPARTLTYLVSGNSVENAQVVMDDRATTELNRRPVLSNELVDGTFVFDQKDVYYNVGVRYRGSPWGRPAKQSYRVRFPDDKHFYRDRGAMNLSNRDRGDGIPYFLISRNARPGKPAPSAEYTYARASINGQPIGMPGFFEPYDRRFVEHWFGDGAADEGVLLKAVGRLRFDDVCNRTGWDEATLLHMNRSSENYRFYWFHGMNQSEDRWEPFMDLTEVIDPRATSDAEFDERIGEVLDVEAFVRVLGPRILMNDGDGQFIGNGHNGSMVRDGNTGLWSYLAFDFGGALGGVNANLFAVRDTGVRRLLSRPAVQRVYYRVIDEYLHGYWSVSAAGPWLDEMQRTVGLGAQVKSFINSSANAVGRQIERFTAAEFRILTNDGEDVATEDPTIEIEGEASVNLVGFFVDQNGAGLEPFVPVFDARNRPTLWRATFDLPRSQNTFRFFGSDGDGALVGPASITVSRGASFVRGDADWGGRVNVTDAVTVLAYLFRGAPIECADAADANDDGRIDLSDGVRILDYVFRGGAPPALPFPDAGADSTPDELGCGE